MSGNVQLDLFGFLAFRDLSEYRHGSTLSSEGIDLFKVLILDHFDQSGRVFAWRQTTDPYHIYISEVMLQQTQTERVKHKFEEWIMTFPDFDTLSQAPFSEVLRCWQGLGYNRRALALHASAKKVMNEYGGILPANPEELVTFNGIGKATAASICAFAYNKPTIFIETNIRTVYIHTFFQSSAKVHDTEIVPLLKATLDYQNPRLWYYALMDYGVALKKQFPNPSRKSAHHTQQSRFEGSERQIRGMILRLLTQHKRLSYADIIRLIEREEDRIVKNLQALIAEGFIREKNGLFVL